ncbi:complement factor H-like [Mus pahari]|uniref:complement factor H-like n=1 Tax=Mus pahari TaxID=10093 RepID=UPI001114E860|nr:complement factor H-like [Mus pahari]
MTTEKCRILLHIFSVLAFLCHKSSDSNLCTCSVSDIEIENGFFSESDFTYALNRETSYRCKQGYVTNTGETSGSITCLQNGWSPQPSCIKSCERPVFENSVTKNNSTWFKLNDKLAYECLHGYKNEYKHTKGSITCTYNGWSDTPSCYEVTCSPPYIPNVIYTSHRITYRTGDVIRYECKNGFYPTTGSTISWCTTYGWIPPPRCSWKHCDFPQFKYGHLFYEDSLKTTFPVSIGKKYSYKCDNGFSPPSGNSRDYLHCTAKGWKPEVPCVRKCVFHYGENGESSDIEQIYVQGQAVKVQCPSGYSFPNDQDTMTCTENGWDPPPKCFRISK